MSIVGAELVQKVQEYLDSQNWNYAISDNAYQLAFDLDNQLEECRMSIQIFPHGDNGFSVLTKTACPLPVPAEKEDRILELITRVNYSIPKGYFSYLSPEDSSEEGIIEYSSRLYCNDFIPSLNDVEAFVDLPLGIMMKYGDALFNVIKSDANPEEEIQRVEG